MALTVGTLVKSAMKDKYVHLFRVTFDNSYATGGLALTAATLGFNDNANNLVVFALDKSGISFEYDAANAKLKALAGTGAHTHTENTAGAYTQNATTGAVTAATFNVGATEIANGTDLSSITTIVFALGNSPA